MLNFGLLIIEIFVLGFILVSMHFIRKQIGLGTLYVFIGSLQFIQTLLVSNVYDNHFLGFKFSPGSTIFYTTTLFSILLFFHYEGIKKTRGLIYGVLISNISVTLFSHFLLIHAKNDAVISSMFFEELLSFELSFFLIGTALMYLESFFIVAFYHYFNSKLTSVNLFIKILVTMAVVCFLDSVLFYGIFYYNSDNFVELLTGNILGKQITVILLSLVFYFYFNFNKTKKIQNKTLEVFGIFTFY